MGVNYNGNLTVQGGFRTSPTDASNSAYQAQSAAAQAALSGTIAGGPSTAAYNIGNAFRINNYSSRIDNGYFNPLSGKTLVPLSSNADGSGFVILGTDFTVKTKKTLTGTNANVDLGIALSDGTYYIGGSEGNSNLRFHAVLNSNFSVKWAKHLNGSGARLTPSGIMETSDGMVLVSDPAIAKINPADGTIVWAKGGGASMYITSDGGTGFVMVDNSSTALILLNSNGTLSSASTFGGTSGALGCGISAKSDASGYWYFWSQAGSTILFDLTNNFQINKSCQFSTGWMSHIVATPNGGYMYGHNNSTSVAYEVKFDNTFADIYRISQGTTLINKVFPLHDDVWATMGTYLGSPYRGLVQTESESHPNGNPWISGNKLGSINQNPGFGKTSANTITIQDTYFANSTTYNLGVVEWSNLTVI